MNNSNKQISNHGKIQGFNKTIQWRHRILVILLSAIFYFVDKNFALAFFLGSLCFHIYYMMLGFSFWSLSFTVPKSDSSDGIDADEAKKQSSKIQPIATFISAIRMAIIALALAILILKLKLSLKGIILAFLAYKIVLLVSGFLDSKKSSK